MVGACRHSCAGLVVLVVCPCDGTMFVQLDGPIQQVHDEPASCQDQKFADQMSENSSEHAVCAETSTNMQTALARPGVAW